MYQFTPPAEVCFRLPDGARRIALDMAMRAGSYDGSGHSDGVGITWKLIGPDGAGTRIRYEHINPRDRPEDRGVLHREVSLPPGSGRILALCVDRGPDGDGAWDWPLFGSLRER